MSGKQKNSMTDAEVLAYVAALMESDRGKRLEAQAERDLKIDILGKMDYAAVGEAYIHFANQMKKSEEFEVESEAVLEAYRLICGIEYLDMWEC